MNNEIELKYQLTNTPDENSTVAAKITAMLTAQPNHFKVNQFQLVNDYYDNDNLDLRKMDFGLRIRTKVIPKQALNTKANDENQVVVQQFEQTIKTAGIVVDGLHKRPEYNVNIQSRKVDLSLFPVNIWPDKSNVEQLQQSLKVIFSTNFSRQTWLIHYGEDIIELALDSGEIIASGGNEKLFINEIEIELVSGSEQALFELAKQLKATISMEPSSLSKAARGYSLYYDVVKNETKH